MSILKGCLKAIGMIILGTAGAASAILSTVSDTVGLKLKVRYSEP